MTKYRLVRAARIGAVVLAIVLPVAWVWHWSTPPWGRLNRAADAFVPPADYHVSNRFQEGDRWGRLMFGGTPPRLRVTLTAAGGRAASACDAIAASLPSWTANGFAVRSAQFPGPEGVGTCLIEGKMHGFNTAVSGSIAGRAPSIGIFITI